MFSFPIAIIPIMLIGSLNSERKPSEKFVIPLILGLLGGLAYLVLRKLLCFDEIMKLTDFWPNFFSFFKANFIPFFSTFFIFAAISRDTAEYKAYSFHVALGAFYAIYVPLKILSGRDGHSFFFIFIYPLMTAALLCILKRETMNIYTKGLKLPSRIISAIIMILALVSEPLSETLWILNISEPAAVTISCILITGALLQATIAILHKNGGDGTNETDSEPVYSSETTVNLE